MNSGAQMMSVAIQHDDAFRKRVHGQALVEDDAGSSAPLDSGRPARFAATISACCCVGGMSSAREAANAYSESNWSALLWRRSNPIVETGLAESPRPQTEPE